MGKDSKGLMVGALLGATAMVVLVHPLLEILHLWRMNALGGASLVSLAFSGIRAAFSGTMLQMTLPMAAIGAGSGLVVSVLLRRRKAEPDPEFPENEESLESLIRVGESERLEFKSSLRWDGKQGRVNKSLELVIAKTLCGMMNHQGGILLIGVSDDGRIPGIEKDLETLRRSDVDGFEQRLVTLATTYLGGRHVKGIRTRFLQSSARTVAMVRVETRPEPVYCQDGNSHRYFVRAGNLTQELDTQEAVAHIAERKRRQ